MDEWAQEGDPNERLFRLGASTLDALTAGVPTQPVARYFEYWLLRLQGVYPPHVACHRCGVALDDEPAGARLQAGSHVFTCRACAEELDGSRDAPGLTLSPGALAFLGSASRVAPQGLGAVSLASAVDRELELAHRALMRAHLEKELRSTRVLRDLRR
jgi:recombinational DNA repair protein (RecF pathway)